MESVFDKYQLWHEHCTSPQSPGQATEVKYLIALIEIREAIEQGFAKLDQTNIEATYMLTGAKETLDGFVENRLKADKVLASVAAAMSEKPPKIQEEPDEPVDKPEKSAVTVNVGEIGKTVSESGIS